MTQPSPGRPSAGKGRGTAATPPDLEGAPSSAGPGMTIPGLSILPLRLFLGATFVYAGYQKITDPGFFTAGSRTYIGTQILSFSHGSPIQLVLHHMMQFAVAIGVLTIATELLIGVLVLLGLFTRVAALVGMALNMVFFLSASWHTYPYFLGADIVFVAAWLTLALTGPGPYALDHRLRSYLHRRVSQQAGASGADLVTPLVLGPPPASDGAQMQAGRRITRAEALVGGIFAAILVALGLIPRGQPGTQTLAGGPSSSKGGPTGSTGAGTGGSRGGASSGTHATPSGIPPNARGIGNVSQLPANSAGTVTDPATGDPAIIVRLPDGKVVAYDAICTHAGCTVEYDQQQHMLVCPCHGGMYDPAHGAAVVAGPPPTPLGTVQMGIDAKGNIYIV